MLKKSGFTHSQQLLIMGIVFLVLFAVIAGPLYNSCRKKEVALKLQAVHTKIKQAKRTYVLENGDIMSNYDVNISPDNFAETYFTPYLKIKHTCKGDNQIPCWGHSAYFDLDNNPVTNKSVYSIVLEDKTIIGFTKNEDGFMALLVDIDGVAGKNKLGRDIFVMYFYNNRFTPKICKLYEYKKYYIADGIHIGGFDKCGIPHDVYSYEDLYSKNLEDGCNIKSPKNTYGFGKGAACAALIKQSQWRIDKIYPW